MTARAATLAVLGAALLAVSLWWPLQPWSLPATVAGIVVLAFGMHGLIAAVDPPEVQPEPQPLPADHTERTEWPAPTDTADFYFGTHRDSEEAA